MAETVTDLLLFIGHSVILTGLRCCIEADFLARFLQVKAKPAAFAAYVGASFLVSFSLGIFQTPSWIQFCVHFLIMCSMAAILLNKADVTALVPCAILASLFALADALSVSILRLLLYASRSLWGSVLGAVWGMAAPFAVTLLLLAVSFFFLRYTAEKYEKIDGAYAISYLHLFLLPCFLIIIIMHFNWGLWDMYYAADSNAKPDSIQAAKDMILLLLAFLSFMAVLAAFFKLTESAERDAEKSNLERQIKLQRQYVAEVQQRNEQYRAFQHDISNHFSVLSGLLSAGKNTEAAQYLRKIKSSAAEVETVTTGSAALDVLLGEKIAYAKRQGIEVTCDMQLCKPVSVDDFDLCVLFGNAMDNAIHACMSFAPMSCAPIGCSPAAKSIQVTSKIKNKFLFVEIENTCTPSNPIVWGTGLKNIKRTVEKYGGTVNTCLIENRFRLSALLQRRSAPPRLTVI